MPDYFNNIAFCFTLFEGYKCNKLYEDISYGGPRKQTSCKSFKFHKVKCYADDFTCVFSIPVKFEIYFLRLR